MDTVADLAVAPEAARGAVLHTPRIPPIPLERLLQRIEHILV